MRAGQFNTRSAMSHMPLSKRAAAGQNDSFEQFLLHPDGDQLRADVDEQLFGARFENLVQLLAGRFTRRPPFERRHFDEAVIGREAEHGAAVFDLEALGVGIPHGQAHRDIARQMVG